MLTLTILIALALLLASGMLYQRAGAGRARSRFPAPGRMIDAGGHRVHVFCAGAGSPAVLFESGIAASSINWSVVQRRIATFTRACAYDRAGFAWSEPSSVPRTFDRIVAELEAVLEAIAPGERCVLVGHSFGSFVVSACAMRHSHKVAGVVLVDPATEWLTPSSQRTRLLRGGRQLSRVGAVLARLGVVRACLALLSGGAPGAPRRFVKVFGPTAAATLERIVGEVRKLPEDVHPVIQAHWCEPKSFHAMAEHLHVLERDRGAIAAASLPPMISLVVISSGDQPPERLEEHRRLAQASAAGRHVIARHSGHWIQFDEPELIVDAVRALTDSARADRRASGTAP